MQFATMMRRRDSNNEACVLPGERENVVSKRKSLKQSGKLWKYCLLAALIGVFWLVHTRVFLSLEKTSEQHLIITGIGSVPSVKMQENIKEVEKKTLIRKAATSKSSVHITHVFNTFSINGKTLSNKALQREHSLVQASWQVAAKQALRQYKLNIEFLCCVLEGEEESCPAFSRVHVIKDWLLDPFNQHKLPTIGTIFSAGKAIGRGELLVYTNADIGTTESFYGDIWRLAKQDSREPDVVHKLTRTAFELMRYCLNFDGEIKNMTSPAICQADTRAYFRQHGGHRMLYDKLVFRDVARLYVQNMTRANPRASTPPKMLRWYMDAGGKQEDSEADLKDVLAFELPMYRLDSQLPMEQSAFTVTRMDLLFRNKEVSATFAPDAQGLQKLIEKAKFSIHPGNDCFVMPRDLVPDMILRSEHPLGWRPWGMWVPHSFEWEFGPESSVDNGVDNLIWRKFEGTANKMYTFHIGESGRVADRWVSLFNLRPLFILQLVANWNQLTQGRFLDLFDVPPVCDDGRLFRHRHYCYHHKKAISDNFAVCSGQVRFACSHVQYPKLRDPFNYELACNRMMKRVTSGKKGQLMVEPYCSFCAGMKKKRGNPESAHHIMQVCAKDKKLIDCGPGHCNFKEK